MAAAIALEALVASTAAWLEPELVVPALAVLVGLVGAWLQAVHPPATAHEHDLALVALMVV